jgi:hypothetical protein
LKKNSGISLIVLVITIIVIIILAGTIILSLANNSPIQSANEARFKSDLKTFQTELNLYETKQYSDAMGKYDCTLLQANGTSVTYNGNVDSSKNINNLISTLQQSRRYDGMFEVVNGELVFKGTDINEQNWAIEFGIAAVNADKNAPTVAFSINGGSGATVSTAVTVTDIGTSNVNQSSLQYVWDTQNTVAPISGWTSFNNGDTLSKTGNGIYYLWIKASDNAGNTATVASNSFVVGSGETPAGTIHTENTTFAGATTGFSYNNPVIPKGFMPVNTLDASWSNLSTDWNKGLVIEDANANQFVWVPVDGTNVSYTKWCTSGWVPYNDSKVSDGTVPSGFSTTSITTTYKGFYIARYESAFDYNGGNIRVASKKSINTALANWATTRNETYNGYLWNNINGADATSYAENMDTSYGYDTAKIGTNLITGAQWDTVMKWIQNSGKNVATDSKLWGNYSNATFDYDYPVAGTKALNTSTLLCSGASSYTKANNIYDLAGNTLEWTSEIYASGRTVRGGRYAASGSDEVAAARLTCSLSGYGDYISFRVALYII